MVHKPKHKVHSFRGLLADGGQDEINLERSNVNLAYRIINLSIITKTPGVDTVEGVVKIYREEQSSVDGVVNFTDTDLLGVGEYHKEQNSAYPLSLNIVFDNVLFSRNIYVTYNDNLTGVEMNYYIELEEVPVGAATLMQLKLGVARKLNLQQD